MNEVTEKVYCIWEQKNKNSIHICDTGCEKVEIISFNEDCHFFQRENERCKNCGKIIKYIQRYK